MSENPSPAFSGNIPYELLLDLHAIYLQGKHKLLSADLQTKEDTRTIWFELNAEMKNFLNELIKDDQVSGFRVYYLAYPNEQTEMHGITIPKNPLDVSQLTIGLVATKTEGSKHPDYYETSSNFKMLVGPPQNHGELCPQICD